MYIDDLHPLRHQHAPPAGAGPPGRERGIHTARAGRRDADRADDRRAARGRPNLDLAAFGPVGQNPQAQAFP